MDLLICDFSFNKYINVFSCDFLNSIIFSPTLYKKIAIYRYMDNATFWYIEQNKSILRAWTSTD